MKRIALIIILAIFYSLWINHWGNNELWKICAYLNILMILVAFLFNSSLGLRFFFYSIFLISEFPRNLFSFQSISTEITQYYNIHTVSIAGFSGSLITLIVIFIISLFKLKGLIPRYGKILPFTISFIFLMLISTALQLIFINSQIFSLKYMISDVKPILALTIGLYFGLVNSSSEKPLSIISDIYNLGLILGLKTIILLTLDLIIEGRVLLEFNNQPYIVFPILFTSLLIKERMRIVQTLILLFGAFTISRSIILFTTLGYLYSIKFYFQYYRKGLKLLFSIPLLLIFCVMIGIVKIPIEVTNFFLFKLQFFTKELISGNLSSSPGIRLYEFLNIVSNMFQNIKVFLIGKGFGSYFEFQSNIQPIKITEFDYSTDQIIDNKYYKPHTFINYTLLKGGIIYFSFYVFLIYSLYKKGKNYLKKSRLKLGLFLIILSFFAPNFFWKFEYMFLFGLILTYQFNNEKENFNNRASVLQKA